MIKCLEKRIDLLTYSLKAGVINISFDSHQHTVDKFYIKQEEWLYF